MYFIYFDAGGLIFELQFAVAESDNHGLLVVDFACNDGFAELVQDEALQSTLDRASTELRIIALASDIVNGVVCHAQVNAALHEHLVYALNLQAHDIADLALVEWSKHYRLINAVQELRANSLL